VPVVSLSVDFIEYLNLVLGAGEFDALKRFVAYSMTM
jgi:hypothetical protein